jgi:hypothetical protein
MFRYLRVVVLAQRKENTQRLAAAFSKLLLRQPFDDADYSILELVLNRHMQGFDPRTLTDVTRRRGAPPKYSAFWIAVDFWYTRQVENHEVTCRIVSKNGDLSASQAYKLALKWKQDAMQAINESRLFEQFPTILAHVRKNSYFQE